MARLSILFIALAVLVAVSVTDAGWSILVIGFRFFVFLLAKISIKYTTVLSNDVM